MALQKHEIRLAIQTLRSETKEEALVQKLLTQLEQIIPEGPKTVKEVIVSWMAHETLLSSAEYSACVSLLVRVWQFTDIDSLVAQEQAVQRQERESDAKAMLPKVDPVAAKIAALEAQLAALKSGSTVVKTATTKVAASSGTHDLSRKMYSLGYSVKQRALRDGATEAQAEQAAIAAKVAFASEHGIEYTPSTPLAAQEPAAEAHAPVVEAIVEQEVPAVEAEGEQGVEADQPTELVEEAHALFGSPDQEVQALLQDLLPQEVAAPEKKRSHKAHAQ